MQRLRRHAWTTTYKALTKLQQDRAIPGVATKTAGHWRRLPKATGVDISRGSGSGAAPIHGAVFVHSAPRDQMASVATVSR